MITDGESMNGEELFKTNEDKLQKEWTGQSSKIKHCW